MTFEFDQILHNISTSHKKTLLQQCAEKLATITNKEATTIMEALHEREKLGSTGLGKGIAIPHARIEGIDRVYAILTTLKEPIEFQAIDDKPVDIVCVLLAPHDAGSDHLQALARVSRTLRDNKLCARIRGASNADAIEALLISDDVKNRFAA